MLHISLFFFFFNDTATTEIYTLSLHDALPIYLVALQRVLLDEPLDGRDDLRHRNVEDSRAGPSRLSPRASAPRSRRSEEHTSELQSRPHLVCRLLLEKKKCSPFQPMRGSNFKL